MGTVIHVIVTAPGFGWGPIGALAALAVRRAARREGAWQ